MVGPNPRLQRTRAAVPLQSVRDVTSSLGGVRRAPLSRKPLGDRKFSTNIRTGIALVVLTCCLLGCRSALSDDVAPVTRNRFKHLGFRHPEVTAYYYHGGKSLIVGVPDPGPTEERKLSDSEAKHVIGILNREDTYSTGVLGCLGCGLGLRVQEPGKVAQLCICLHCYRIMVGGGAPSGDLILSTLGVDRLRRFFREMFPSIPANFSCGQTP